MILWCSDILLLTYCDISPDIQGRWSVKVDREVMVPVERKVDVESFIRMDEYARYTVARLPLPSSSGQLNHIGPGQQAVRGGLQLEAEPPLLAEGVQGRQQAVGGQLVLRGQGESWTDLCLTQN